MDVIIEEEDNIITEIQETGEQGAVAVPRKTNRERAAERRELTGDRFKKYQEIATKKLLEKANRKKVNLDSTRPLSEIKDSLKRLSEEFNFGFRGIDANSRLYLGKGKHGSGVGTSNPEVAPGMKKIEK